MAEETTQKQNFTGVAIVFAVFAAILIVAFLAYRDSDVGQLPHLLGKLGGDPIFGYGIVESIYGTGAAFLVSVSWFGLGSLLYRLIRVPVDGDSLVLIRVQKVAIGAAVWSLIWFLLGLAGLYNGWTAVACIIAGFIPAIPPSMVIARRLPELPPNIEKLLLFLIAVPIVLALIGALAPPTAKDTLLYHFALPQAFVAQHSNAFVEGNIASYLAMGTEMHYVWAMLAAGIEGTRAGEAAAGVTGFLFFPLLLLAVYGWARETGISQKWSLFATLMVASVPTAFYAASSGYIDIALALFMTLAVYSLTRWWKEQTAGWSIAVAIFLGAALSIKLTAVFVFAAFALIILLRARSAEIGGKIAISGFASILIAGAIASPWYLRTWIATGSPVFPFYMNIWKGTAAGWDVDRSNLFQTMNSQYGAISNNGLDYLLAPLRASVFAQPERAIYFDGVLGVAFLIGLPIVIWALWKFDLAIGIKIGAGVAGIMFLFWLFSSQQLRYLLPILPVMAIGIAASVEAIAAHGDILRSVWKYSFMAASITCILTSLAWFCQRAPLRVVLGGETRDQYLTRNLDYYPYYQWINTETAPDAKVWLINMRRDTYNLDRPIFSDYLFEDWTLKKMVWESRNVQELKAKAASMGVQYVLTRHDFLFDYDKSTIVDDKKPRADNEAKLKIARDFILDKANTIRADEKFSLIKVF